MDAGLNRRENNENGNPNSAVAAAAAAVVVSPNPRRVKKKKKLHKQVAPSEMGSKPARWFLTKLMKWLRYPHDWVKDTWLADCCGYGDLDHDFSSRSQPTWWCLGT
ncbi:hypothetical protein TB1_009755 [Malus domestica]